jgi:hypothetical protein
MAIQLTWGLFGPIMVQVYEKKNLASYQDYVFEIR